MFSKNITVKIEAETDRLFPNSNKPYKLRLKASVSNTRNKTLEKAVYAVYSKDVYGTITNLTFEVI